MYAEILNHLYRMLPEKTGLFSRGLPDLEIIQTSSNTYTCSTSKPHGFEEGSTVLINNLVFHCPIVSAVFTTVDEVSYITFEMATNAISEPFLDGVYEITYNGTQKKNLQFTGLKFTPDNKFYAQVKNDGIPTAGTTFNSLSFRTSNARFSYYEIAPADIIDDFTFNIVTPDELDIYSRVDFVPSVGVHVYLMNDTIDVLEHQKSFSAKEASVYVIPSRVNGEKDREIKGDALALGQSGASARQMLTHSFNTIVACDNSNTPNGAFNIEQFYSIIFPALINCLWGFKPPTHLTTSCNGGIVFSENPKIIDDNKAKWYAVMGWEFYYEITETDTVFHEKNTPADTNSFKSICYKLLNANNQLLWQTELDLPNSLNQ
jgi:hypothetical protein